jgi:hypothetical protein
MSDHKPATAEITPHRQVRRAAPLKSNSLAAARARGALRVAEILEQPEMLSSDGFAALTGTTRATVNTWRNASKILGLEGAKRGFRFPAWQVGEDGKPFAAIPALFAEFNNSPWAVYRFLVQHHPELGGLTGLAALQRGRTKQALEAASSSRRAFS